MGDVLVTLDPGAETTLRRLAGLIARSPHNLVSARERAAVFERHVAEAVAVAGALDPSPAPGSRWMDLGTGGGLPGLVFAVLWPDVHWTLLDATAKKVEAVTGFAAELGLVNTRVVHGRAQELGHQSGWRGAFDGVAARAVAPLDVLVELARGFLRPGAVLAAVKGPAYAAELAAASPALRVLAYGRAQVVAVEGTARPTWLVTIPAVGPPPAAYPRRRGQPRK